MPEASPRFAPDTTGCSMYAEGKRDHRKKSVQQMRVAEGVSAKEPVTAVGPRLRQPKSFQPTFRRSRPPARRARGSSSPRLRCRTGNTTS